MSRGAFLSRIANQINSKTWKGFRSDGWPQANDLSRPSLAARTDCRAQATRQSIRNVVSTRHYCLPTPHLLQHAIAATSSDRTSENPRRGGRRGQSQVLWTLEEDNILYEAVKQGKKGYEVYNDFPYRTPSAIEIRISWIRNATTIPVLPDGTVQSLAKLYTPTIYAERRRVSAIKELLKGLKDLDPNGTEAKERWMKLKEFEEEKMRHALEKYRQRTKPNIKQTKRPWTDKEIAVLRRLVGMHSDNPAKWSKVSNGAIENPDGSISILNRSAHSCRQKWFDMTRPDTLHSGTWSVDEQQRLSKAVGESVGDMFQPIVDIFGHVPAAKALTPRARKLASSKDQSPSKDAPSKDTRPALTVGSPMLWGLDWHAIAEKVGTRDKRQCQAKLYSLHNGNHGPWTAEEKRLLQEGMQIYGNRWRGVTTHVGSRSIPQVRAMARFYKTNNE